MRLGAALALVLVCVAALPPAIGATVVDDGRSSAESLALSLMNQQRASAGLRPLRLDVRLGAIARERSEQMATYDYFSHQLPDGRSCFALLGDYGITWYKTGEIIAFNYAGSFDDSARSVIRQWMGSSAHRAIMLSSEMNYVGLGTARQDSTGRTYWTGYFIKGPDRTGAWTKMASPLRVGWTRTSTGLLALKTTFRWSGGDVLLQTLTSGFYRYQIRLRTNGGDWRLIASSTTRTYWTALLVKGRTYELQVRARDRAGNYGSWRTARVTP